MSDYISPIIYTFLYTFFFILYFFGMYVIISDDHRYATKDVVIGAIFFPYPWVSLGPLVFCMRVAVFPFLPCSGKSEQPFL